MSAPLCANRDIASQGWPWRHGWPLSVRQLRQPPASARHRKHSRHFFWCDIFRFWEPISSVVWKRLVSIAFAANTDFKIPTSSSKSRSSMRKMHLGIWNWMTNLLVRDVQKRLRQRNATKAHATSSSAIGKKWIGGCSEFVFIEWIAWSCGFMPSCDGFRPSENIDLFRQRTHNSKISGVNIGCFVCRSWWIMLVFNHYMRKHFPSKPSKKGFSQE